jgi:hypothetical protein
MRGETRTIDAVMAVPKLPPKDDAGRLEMDGEKANVDKENKR